MSNLVLQSVHMMCYSFRHDNEFMYDMVICCNVKWTARHGMMAWATGLPPYFKHHRNRLQVMVENVHGGPRRGAVYNFIPCQNFRFCFHDNVFWNGCHSNIFWDFHHENLFERIASVTKYWPSRRFNWRLKMIMEDSRRPGLYHVMLLWIAWDVYPFVVCTLWFTLTIIRVISHNKYQVKGCSSKCSNHL